MFGSCSPLPPERYKLLIGKRVQRFYGPFESEEHLWDGWVESYVGWVRETTDWRNSKIEAKAWPEERNVFKVKWSDKSVLKLCLEDVLKHIVEDDAKWTSRCKQRGGAPPSSGNEER